MNPRFSSAWSHVRNSNLISTSLRARKASRLTLAAAAASVATIAGVAASAAGPATALAAANSLPGASNASTVLAASGGSPVLDGGASVQPAATAAQPSTSGQTGSSAQAGAAVSASTAGHAKSAHATPAAHTNRAATASPAHPAPSAHVTPHAATSARQHGHVEVAARQRPGHSSGRSGHGSRHQTSGVARPWLIFDSVTPSAIPGHHEVATYADGGFAVSPSQVSGRSVLWIDTRGTDPAASALDVEPGDATPSAAANWVWRKLHNAAGEVAIIYTMRSEWPAVQAAVRTLPSSMQSHVRWWIADPTGVPHVVPGSQATQWYWGTKYDISTAMPGF